MIGVDLEQRFRFLFLIVVALVRENANSAAVWRPWKTVVTSSVTSPTAAPYQRPFDEREAKN